MLSCGGHLTISRRLIADLSALGGHEQARALADEVTVYGYDESPEDVRPLSALVLGRRVLITDLVPRSTATMPRRGATVQVVQLPR